MAGVHMHSRIVQPIPSDDVYLTHTHHTAYRHGDRDDGQIHVRKVETLDVDIFPRQDVTPQDPSQRDAEGRAADAIVDTQCHAVDRGPEGAVCDGDVVEVVDFLPCLNDTREKDVRADVCSGELRVVS